MKILAIGDFHGKLPEKFGKLVKDENIDLILSTGDYAGIDKWRAPLKKVFKAREKGIDLSIEEVMSKKNYSKLLKEDYEAGKIVLKKLNRFKIRTFSVFGNGDWYEVFFNTSRRDYSKFAKKLKFIKDINRGKGSFRSIKIVGFGGYLDPDAYFTKKGMQAINESSDTNKKRKKRYNKWAKQFLKIMKNKPDILLTHYTPYKCLDKMDAKSFALHKSHMGVKFFNKGIKQFKPRLVVCGHMHENQGTCKINNTLVVNPGPANEGKAAIIEYSPDHKIKNIRFIR